MTRALDDATRDALIAAVDAAKADGWTQDDLRAWFDSKGVSLAQYLKAKVGGEIPEDARSVFAMVSITGLPSRPKVTAEDPFPELPDAMKAAKRWLLWKLEPNADPTKKPRKVPYYTTGAHRTGALDTPEDCARLADYEEACQAYAFNAGTYAGLGFALGPDEGGQHWQGIDLDNLDQHPGLRFVADDLPGYVERSPSGAGVHAIGYGRAFHSLGSNTTGIEAYAQGRYFTVTGESLGLGDLSCLADFVEARLAPLHTYRPQDTSAPAEPGGSLAGAMAVADLRSALASMRSDERDLWVRMGHALRSLGDQGRGLWLEWSQTSDKYDPADAARVWDSFKPERTGFQAVFAEAQRRGWVNPASIASRAVEPATQPVVEEDTGERFIPGGFTGELPPPRAWAYGSFLMYQATSGVAAPPGVGKTTFSFQIAIAFGLDLNFGPWSPVPGGGGRVWLFNGEEPREELDRRFLAACIEMGVESAEAARRVAYNSGLDERLTLVRLDPRGETVRSPDVDLIKARIRASGFKLFIVDPLIEIHAVKEDTEGFHAIGAALREIAHDCDCAVLFFHHTPKAANADTAAGDMNAMRGGGPIVGVARFIATMFSMTTKDAEEYGVPARERLRYVRFDDAKANMAMMSAEPQWWAKLGVSIDNAHGVRPADNIGVLRFERLRAEPDPTSMQQVIKAATERENRLDRIAAELVRVCLLNGYTSPETAGAMDAVVRGLDVTKTGFRVNKTKDIVIGEMGLRRISGSHELVISTVERGSLTVRKVHAEAVPDEA
jgi:hypothetical protein